MNLFDFFAPPPPVPPWEAFPDSFGYLREGQAVVCTREELERMCVVERIPRRVWTPGSGGPVGPEEVPFLLRAIRRRLLQRPLRVSAMVALFGALLVGQEAGAEGIALGSPAALYLAMVVSLLAVVGHSAWRAARLSPQGFRDLMERELRSGRVRRLPVRYTPWLAGMMVLCGVAQLMVIYRAGGTAPLLAQGNEFGVFPAAVDAEPVLRNGEWWRMLTAAFVHAGPLHFAVNFLALIALGRDAEMYAGRGVFPVVFLASVIGGSALGLVLPPDAPSVGNSGGLVGVIGYLGVLAWRRPRQVPPGLLNSILVNVGLLVGIGVVGYALIDNAGHAGGGLVGAALGLATIPSERRRAEWTTGRAWMVAGLVAMAVLAAAAGLTARLVMAA